MNDHPETGYAFDRETEIVPAGEGRWNAHVVSSYNIGGNPNGGYLASIGMRALQTLGPHGDPLTVTVHFLRPGTGDADAQVEAQLIRTGRSITTGRASLVQGGKQRIEMLAGLGDLSASSAIDHALDVPPPPDMPGPDECEPRSGAEQGVDLPVLDRLETRIHPGQVKGGQAGKATVSGWIRFADGREPDALAALLMADAFPPPVFGLLGVIGWVPTIELTVHIRRRPAPGWILGQFETSDLHDGRMVENGKLWDSQGHLVAQSRQLSMLLSE